MVLSSTKRKKNKKFVAQVTVHVKPPTLDDHNIFVRTPICTFLDSMERSLSLKSIHI